MPKKVILAAMAAALLATPTAHAADFNYPNVFAIWAQRDPVFDYGALVDDYMHTYRYQVWSKYRSDEFEFAAKRAETLKMMKDAVAKVKADETLVIRTKIPFGEYNFEKSTFDMAPFSADNFFTADCGCHLPDLKIFFSNPELIDGLSMPPEQAKPFLASRKTAWDSIDRQLPSELQIVITEYKPELGLIAKLTSVKLFSDEARKKLVREIKAPE